MTWRIGAVGLTTQMGGPAGACDMACITEMRPLETMTSCLVGHISNGMYHPVGRKGSLNIWDIGLQHITFMFCAGTFCSYISLVTLFDIVRRDFISRASRPQNKVSFTYLIASPQHLSVKKKWQSSLPLCVTILEKYKWCGKNLMLLSL